MEMQKHAETIKVDEVMERARKVAGRLVERELGDLGPDAVRIGVHPGFGTVGLIIDRDRLQDFSHKKAFEMASTIAGEFDDIALPGSAHAVFVEDYLIIGLIPRPFLEVGGFR